MNDREDKFIRRELLDFRTPEQTEIIQKTQGEDLRKLARFFLCFDEGVTPVPDTKENAVQRILEALEAIPRSSYSIYEGEAYEDAVKAKHLEAIMQHLRDYLDGR